MTDHELNKHCRVCGGRLQKAKRRAAVHTCILHTEALKATFELDVTTDDADVHPQAFCNGCYAAIQRNSTAMMKGLPYHHSIQVFPWHKHTEECSVRTTITFTHNTV